MRIIAGATNHSAAKRLEQIDAQFRNGIDIDGIRVASDGTARTKSLFGMVSELSVYIVSTVPVGIASGVIANWIWTVLLQERKKADITVAISDESGVKRITIEGVSEKEITKEILSLLKSGEE